MKNQTPNKVNGTAGPANPAPMATSDAASTPTDIRPPLPSDEGFISREELARRLHKSIRTIAYWQRRRIIPFVKIENSTWFNWLDVQNHLERNFRVSRKQSQEPPHRIPVIGTAGDGLRKDKTHD